MALTMVTGRLKSRVKVVWLDIIDVIAIVFLVLGIITSISITQNTWDQIYMTVYLSRGLFYLSFPIGCFISIFHLVHHILTRDTASVASVFTDDDINVTVSSQKEV